MDKVEALNAIDYQGDSDSYTLCEVLPTVLLAGGIPAGGGLGPVAPPGRGGLQ